MVRRKKQQTKGTTFKPGDRVVLNDWGSDYVCEFIGHGTGDTVSITYEGDEYDVPVTEISLADVTVETDELHGNGLGFHQYNINWDDKRVNFKCTLESPDNDGEAGPVTFNGSWRQAVFTHRTGYAIDIWAVHNKRTYSVRSILYADDPRENIDSLDSDICAAVNMFFFTELRGDADTLTQLQRRADQPRVTIRSIEAIDQIIIDLQAFRAECLTLGGRRLFSMQGQADGDPVIGVQADLTKQAQTLKNGRVPPVGAALGIDDVAAGATGKRAARRTGTQSISEESLNKVLESLAAANERGDKVTARKLRAQLRRLGHKGGGKRRKAAAETPEPTKPARKKKRRRKSK